MNLTIFNQLDFLPALREFFKVLQVPIAAVTDKPIAAGIFSKIIIRIMSLFG
jgi:hypothetical protein